MPEQPNVLLIMTDQQKATASHLYGNSFCETPSLDRLARRGVLYEHAITPHPLCQPARCALWTGQFPHQNGCRDNQTPMPHDALHAFKIWHEQGYHCGLIGKNHCFEHPDDIALFETWNEISHHGIPKSVPHRGAGWFRPRDAIEAAHVPHNTMTPQNVRFGYAISDAPLEDHSTGLIAGQTQRFLQHHKDEPFALWVSFPDPHEPWVCPRYYTEMFPPEEIELPVWRDDEFNDLAPGRNGILHAITSIRDESIDEVYGLLACYYGMIRFIDDAVGQILDTLDALNLSGNTIVVFCSDHGDLMGEHGMHCKGGVFYDALVRVPLIISYPDVVPVDVRDTSMANLVDVVPTLLSLQGHTVPKSMQGQPLPTVTNAKPRAATFSEYGKGGAPFTWKDLQALQKPFGRKTLLDSLQWREAEGFRKMIRTSDWKFIHDPMGDKDELYDLATDSGELFNVIDNPANTPVVSLLRSKLNDWRIEPAEYV